MPIIKIRMPPPPCFKKRKKEKRKTKNAHLPIHNLKLLQKAKCKHGRLLFRKKLHGFHTIFTRPNQHFDCNTKKMDCLIYFKKALANWWFTRWWQCRDRYYNFHHEISMHTLKKIYHAYSCKVLSSTILVSMVFKWCILFRYAQKNTGEPVVCGTCKCTTTEQVLPQIDKYHNKIVWS